MDLQAFGQRVRQVREMLGLSQRAFSELIGVSSSRLSMVEGGRSESGVTLPAQILSSVPNISARWLLMGDRDMLMSDPSGDDPSRHTSSQLKDLESSASFSPQPEFWETYRAIYESPSGLALEELPGDPRTASRRVRVLEGDGLVSETGGRWVAQHGILWAHSQWDTAALSLRVVENVSEILELTRQSPDDASARLMVVRTADPSGLRHEIVSWLEQRLLREEKSPEGELTMVVAIRCDKLEPEAD